MEAILQAKEISKTYHTGSVDVPALKQCSLEFYQYRCILPLLLLVRGRFCNIPFLTGQVNHIL